MAQTQSTNPRPFGLVTVAAGGTPARATANQTDPAARVGLQSIMFQVRPANTGVIYIRMRGVGATPLSDDRATLLYTLAVLPAPGSATLGPFASVTFAPAGPIGAPFNLADFYIDAGVNGDGCLVSGVAG
jgi:hypothetical protein